MKTPYDVLGVAPDADEKTIASAFREAAKACHPDLNPEGRASEQQFKQVVAARDALKDPERRALYRYLQLGCQHERRHWMITIASCTLSALVSAGLVGLLQKPSISEPLLEDRALLDPGVEIGSRQSGFALAGTSADPSPSGDNDPLQIAAFREPNAVPPKEEGETDAPGSRGARGRTDASPDADASARPGKNTDGRQQPRHGKRQGERAASSPGAEQAAHRNGTREQPSSGPSSVVAARTRDPLASPCTAIEACFEPDIPHRATLAGAELGRPQRVLGE
jgi:curved DNA-binding protein CbpA